MFPCKNISGFITQLVKASHRYREVTDSNPVEVLTVSRNYINCVHNCVDHSSLDFISAVLIWFISYTSITFIFFTGTYEYILDQLPKSFSIKHLLEKQDRKVFRKVSGIDRHPLRGLLPKKKVSTYNLRNRTSQYPKVNTDRFKNSYINRLIFNYDLAMWAYFFFIFYFSLLIT